MLRKIILKVAFRRIFSAAASESKNRDRMNPSEEMLEVVDPSGSVIGLAPRFECHNNPRLLHRTVHILIFTSREELVLQRRALTKDIQPGKWDSSVGGHISPGETVEECAEREMKEELGLENVGIRFLHKYTWQTQRESELVVTYTAVHDGPFTQQESEIDCVRCWTKNNIIRHLGTGIFTPNFEYEWDLYQRRFHHP